MITLDKSILERAIEQWGHLSQMGMLHEECLELALALHKASSRAGGRGVDTAKLLDNVYDELGDVIIMVEQAKIVMNNSRIQKVVNFNATIKGKIRWIR